MADLESSGGVGGVVYRIPFHPILIAAAPALIMLAANIDQIRPSAATRAILYSFIAGVGLLLALRIALRDWRWAAAFTTVVVLFFFSYGQVYAQLQSQGEWGWAVARHRYLLPTWLVAFSGSVVAITKLRRYLGPLTTTFNLVAVIVVAMPVVQIAVFELKSATAASQLSADATTSGTLRIPEGESAPDIYYIIPDAYDRDDYLLSEYGYDNGPFLRTLEEMGFYVARCSQSNYNATDLSLPASLNMNYLEALGDRFQAGNSEKHGLDELIRHSRVRSELEALGYSVVAFETGFFYTQLDDADHYYSLPKEGSMAQLLGLQGLNGFEAMLVQNSGARVLTDVGNVTGFLMRLLPDLDRPRSIYRDRTLYVLDQLAPDKVPSLRGPKFVFVHIVSPHFPYVIDRDGEFVNRETPDDDKEAYVDQLVYLNGRLTEILKGIIEGTDPPPIVILQSDHGNGTVRGNATEILNAYYLPGEGSEGLYPEISPVNTFRLIFDTYFSGSFGLLENASYSSSHELPYDLTPIPDKRPGCGEDG